MKYNKHNYKISVLIDSSLLATLVFGTFFLLSPLSAFKNSPPTPLDSLYNSLFFVDTAKANEANEANKATNHLITKRNAEKCPRGQFGEPPSKCEPCGECFDDWDKIISDLANKTNALLDRVRLLLQRGYKGGHGDDFDAIEAMLEKIKQILANIKLTEKDILELERKLKEMYAILKEVSRVLQTHEQHADSIFNRTLKVKSDLSGLSLEKNNLFVLLEQLQTNATIFQDWNVDSAYNAILDARNRSRNADSLVKSLQPFQWDTEQKRRETNSILDSMSSKYNSTINDNEAMLAELARQISSLESRVPGINELVCQSSTGIDVPKSCDALCGGALCQDRCGGSSCSQAATTKAHNALEFAQKALDILAKKFNKQNTTLAELNEAKLASELAVKEAREALDACNLQRAAFEKINAQLNALIDDVNKFSFIGAKPADVKARGEYCLSLAISLKPEEIIELAKKINETLGSLTNIDKIIKDTDDDLKTANALREQADRAKAAADDILKTAELVLEMLRLAAAAQAKALAAIEAATGDLQGAQNDLAEIKAETSRAAKVIKELEAFLSKLKDKLNELRKKYSQNELYVSQAKAAADEAARLTNEAERYVQELADKVREAEDKLRDKLRLSGELRDRAERLRNDAAILGDDLASKMNLAREFDDLFADIVKSLIGYQEIVDELSRLMNGYLKDINARAQFYRECHT